MKGIAIAGSVLVDRINEVALYPKSGELTKILNVSRAVGGCVPNVAIDLKTLAPALDVSALGNFGDDEDGAYVKEELASRGIDVSGLVAKKDARTSFTEVISVQSGQRTFFTYNGANASFGYDSIDYDALQVKMLHLGYFLLLDKLDAGEGVPILKKLQEMGIKTSIDLVSESASAYRKVLPCLAYTDSLIINETVAGGLTGMEPTDENLPVIAKKLKEAGVKERVIIHKPEYSLCYSDKLTVLASFDLPKGFVKGSTGAGDAFCAGCLLAIYNEKSDEDVLRCGSVAAVAALSAADSVSGMRSLSDAEELCATFKRKEICL